MLPSVEPRPSSFANDHEFVRRILAHSGFYLRAATRRQSDRTADETFVKNFPRG
jgi:hypothetical protein